MKQMLRLAWADLWHERIISLCQVLALAAVLSPLLVLFGLQHGVIGGLVARLNADPAMRELIPEVAGSNRFDAAWFERMAARDNVAFVIPNTRAIAGQVDMISAAGAKPGMPLRVSWLPTRAGDPLRAGQEGGAQDADLGLTGIVLSERIARELGLAAGAPLQALVERSRQGRVEPLLLDLRVVAVVPAALHDGRVGFVSLALLEAVQAYRDGLAVAAFGMPGAEPAAEPLAGAMTERQTYPLFRLYAASIRQVGALAADLRAEGIEVYSREREIAGTLGLERNLSAVLLIISGFAALGYVVALAATQYSNVERKRRHLALLKLIGYGRWRLALLPVLEAALISLAGGMLALGLFRLAAWAINSYFAGHLAQDEIACWLPASAHALALLASIVLSLLPATANGMIANKYQPSRELRDV